MFKVSEEASIKRDNLKLNFLQNKMKSIITKKEKLPINVAELSTFRKVRMNIAENNHEIGVAVKRYCTVNKEVFEERVQNRLDRKHLELETRAIEIQGQVEELVLSLDPANRVKEHAKPEVEKKKSIFNIFDREPVPETN